jgi:hypothetical protein
MHSFVDQMDDIIWTEVDIINRTETMIRKEFSCDAENILARKTSAAMMGQYTLDPLEYAEIQRYAIVCSEAQAAGKKAREDMSILMQTLDYEKANAILEAGREKSNEVAWAENIILNASPEVISLAGERARFKANN